MEVEQENIPSLPPGNEPLPLSQEGGSAQLELDVKSKAQEKKTTVNFKDKSFIKKIIDTPKEGASAEPTPSGGQSSQSESQAPPKEDTDAIIARLNTEEREYESTPPPSLEECEDTADFIIDLADTGIMVLIQWYSQDSSDKDYQIDEGKKRKLKKHLAKLLVRMGKKYPLGIMFIIMVLACYIPAGRKAHAHRKLVDEERAKNKPNAPILSDEPRRRRRRSNNDTEPTYYHAEEVK